MKRKKWNKLFKDVISVRYPTSTERVHMLGTVLLTKTWKRATTATARPDYSVIIIYKTQCHTVKTGD